MAEKTIKLKLQEASELFSPFDPDQRTLSADVADYLKQSISSKHIGIQDRCTIQLQCDEPLDADTVRQTIREHFTAEKSAANRALRVLSYKAICLAAFGAIVLLILFLPSVDWGDVASEVLDIICWVAIWEATSIIIMQTYEPRQLKKSCIKLMNAQIIITQ